MADQRVVLLNKADTLEIVKDAKLVAIRWDLVPWCLVFDLDSPLDERQQAPVRRAWVIFAGMSEWTISLDNARLPNGVFIIHPLFNKDLSNGFYEFTVSFLAPRFDSDDTLINNPHNKMVITAQNVIGVASVASAWFGEFAPTRDQRNSLATEDELLLAVGNA